MFQQCRQIQNEDAHSDQTQGLLQPLYDGSEMRGMFDITCKGCAHSHATPCYVLHHLQPSLLKITLTGQCKHFAVLLFNTTHSRIEFRASPMAGLYRALDEIVVFNVFHGLCIFLSFINAGHDILSTEEVSQ